MMEVTFLNSADFDLALLENKHAAKLDRKLDDWQDAQIDLIEILEAELKASYGEEVFENDELFISSNISPAKVLQMDIYDSILNTSLVTALIGFLRENAPDCAILSSINHVDENLIDTVSGQFYVNLREICVKESAKAIWNLKVCL